MSAFPAHPDDITADWWNATLGRVPDRWRWEPIGTGQVGDSVRFTLDFAGEARPVTLAGKFAAADPNSRGTAAMLGLYTKEVRFYRELAPQLPIRTPNTLFAEIAEDGASFFLLFEDLGPARGGNQIAGCSLGDARAVVQQAAALHGPSWHNPAMLDQDWLQPDPAAAAKVRTLYPQAQAIFRERYRDVLEPEYMALCEALAEITATTDRAVQRTSLVHGDFRLDNVLFDIKGGAEPVAVLDWQTLTIGNGLTDIGYFLGCGIGDALRREHERELLDLYCAEMTLRGVPISRDTIWQDYVLGALHGVSTAVFSSAFVVRTPRGDANFLSMARGACALCLAHGSLELMKKG
ncbi:aminoglycoside phosphotransferase family protein [Erythrobacter sanguineus]|uniref:Predicted kinase, aminoglycoside phosphotransferase (APT) family n=1 Tax=Erythrobacter sanguineus TaxID=198312 RepID=A0A1M7SG88_9SPHN|nr:aminoglycoside phosphotransferase family protein [Erythrobacter sanguineus]SHN57493.1 Predicted kinase, aminoglycoside phosphotransferase (APT) family [Erythrobacter sanguineus]